MSIYSNGHQKSCAHGADSRSWYIQPSGPDVPVTDAEYVERCWEGLAPTPHEAIETENTNDSSYPPGYVEGVRLSEELTGPFQRYMERFIRYFPKTCYHAKRTYDGGWPQPKVKRGPRTGKPATLFDSGEFRYLTETVERHLDYHQWANWKDRDRLLPRKDAIPQFWLALNAPRYTDHENIDIDSKRVLGYYHTNWDQTGLLRPVMQSAPATFSKKLNRFMTLFPVESGVSHPRAWACTPGSGISTFCLSKSRRQPILERLDAIGFKGTEVHPMPG